jgi:putative PIG3 family NAD(P)H quinone oxidoreductase
MHVQADKEGATANLPSSMTIAAPRQAGGPEMLALMQHPRPTAAAGEVLLKVRSAGVNRADCLQRMGQYPVPAGATDIIGLECAGEVVAVGGGVQGWQVGDSACALLIGGGYAEYVNVPAGQCLPVPASLGWDAAASLMETCCTVWSNVHLRAALQPGETLLVHGGSSGIGVTALQIFSALGHRVFTTAGSEDKCAACLGLGAEMAINYRTQDFVEQVLQATGGRGVDVILDMVGGDYMPRNMKALADDGRLAGIAATRGREVPLNLMEVYRRRLTITGSALRRQPLAEKARIVESVRQHVWPLIESGRFKAVVHSVFPLAEAAAAHQLMESSEHIGKIVLRVA